ncbi:Origin of replication complex subunit 6 [Coemansia sp. RSA 552]|nr:Origin of replication complex subunit 6 [Coemansia sp. RSA 552]
MSALLADCIAKLQLDGIPKLAPKAAQFFDQIGQLRRSTKGSAGGGLVQCRQAVSVQLACENLSVEFNEAAACSLSSMAPPAYRACVQEARAALGLTKHVTLEELDVQYGPPPGVVEYSRRLLEEFRRTLGAVLPAAASRSMNWDDSVYIVGAFYLVCKHMKKRVATKAELVSAAATKNAVFVNATKKLTEFGKATLAAIDAGGTSTPRTPARKRARGDLAANPVSTPASTRGKQPSTPVAAIAVEDELGCISRKRPKRAVSTRQASADPAQVTPSTCRPLAASPAPAPVPKKTSMDTKTPAKRKMGRSLKAAPLKKETAPRLRIGIVSMVQNRDYRSTLQFESYQRWKADMLKTKC